MKISRLILFGLGFIGFVLLCGDSPDLKTFWWTKAVGAPLFFGAAAVGVRSARGVRREE